jgi:hypothetical protein
VLSSVRAMANAATTGAVRSFETAFNFHQSFRVGPTFEVTLKDHRWTDAYLVTGLLRHCPFLRLLPLSWPASCLVSQSTWVS